MRLALRIEGDGDSSVVGSDLTRQVWVQWDRNNGFEPSFAEMARLAIVHRPSGNFSPTPAPTPSLQDRWSMII